MTKVFLVETISGAVVFSKNEFASDYLRLHGFSYCSLSKDNKSEIWVKKDGKIIRKLYEIEVDSQR